MAAELDQDDVAAGGDPLTPTLLRNGRGAGVLHAEHIVGSHELSFDNRVHLSPATPNAHAGTPHAPSSLAAADDSAAASIALSSLGGTPASTGAWMLSEGEEEALNNPFVAFLDDSHPASGVFASHGSAAPSPLLTAGTPESPPSRHGSPSADVGQGTTPPPHAPSVRPSTMQQRLPLGGASSPRIQDLTAVPCCDATASTHHPAQAWVTVSADDARLDDGAATSTPPHPTHPTRDYLRRLLLPANDGASPGGASTEGAGLFASTSPMPVEGLFAGLPVEAGEDATSTESVHGDEEGHTLARTRSFERWVNRACEPFLVGENKVIDVAPEFAFFKTPEGTRVPGSFIATNFGIYFEPSEAITSAGAYSDAYFQVPLATICKIDTPSSGSSFRATVVSKATRTPVAGSDTGVLVLGTRDGRKLRFGFSHAFLAPVARVIEQFAFPNLLTFSFAFYHWPGGRLREAGSTPDVGWSLYDFRQEMQRQGALLPATSDGSQPVTNPWRVFDNSDFSTCPTYPPFFMVPRLSSDTAVHAVAKFRSKGRVPSLTWTHRDCEATLWRSSQPRVGIASNSCREDEALLRQVRCAQQYIKAHMASAVVSSETADVMTTPSTRRRGASTSGGAPPQMLIADCRPRANAVANKAAGMGYTSYKSTPLVFLGIHNIHVVRESHKKLMTVCKSPPSSAFLSDVEDSGWLQHLRSILEGASRVATAVHSDGWDRTSQVVALAQLMLDPYFRTLEGFCVLIAKDWLSFGHRFRERLGHASRSGRQSTHVSPIFLQFLDCCWQLVHCCPQMFEFSPRTLLAVADHIYSCRFGTFLANCERERDHEDHKARTRSLFSYILQRKRRFTNPFYSPTSTQPVLLPSATWIRANVTLWRDLHLRWCALPMLPHSITRSSYDPDMADVSGLSASSHVDPFLVVDTPEPAGAAHDGGSRGSVGSAHAATATATAAVAAKGALDECKSETAGQPSDAPPVSKTDPCESELPLALRVARAATACDVCGEGDASATTRSVTVDGARVGDRGVGDRGKGGGSHDPPVLPAAVPSRQQFYQTTSDHTEFALACALECIERLQQQIQALSQGRECVQ